MTAYNYDCQHVTIVVIYTRCENKNNKMCEFIVLS